MASEATEVFKKKADAESEVQKMSCRSVTKKGRIKPARAPDMTPEQIIIWRQQISHDQMVDDKHRVKLESRSYKPGTPEFNAIAEDYIRRERAAFRCSPISQEVQRSHGQREKNKTSGICANWGSFLRMG